MLSWIVAANSRLSCRTTLACARSEASVYSRMSRPSISTRPAVGSYSRRMKLTKVDFPLPDGPTNATCCPASTSQSIASSAGWPGS